MRVLQIVPSLNSGGVERCVAEISNYLISQGDEVFVMSSGGWMQMLFNKKCKHIKANVATKNPFKIISNAKYIRKFCEENKIDIVHVHSRAPAWSCYLARKRSKFKLVTTVHAMYSKSNIIKKYYNSIMLKSDTIITVSDFLKNHIIQEYNTMGKKINIVKRGIEVDVFSRSKVSHQRLSILVSEIRIPDNKFIITVPARITECKGHLYVIQALSMIKHADYLCVFVGDWNKKRKYKNKLENIITKLNMEDKISFVGSVKDMAAMYFLSDLVILPSIKPESFGKVIIEAGAMGCTILSTNIGNPRDIIVNGVNGFLVEPRDALSMSRKIINIINSGINKDTEYKDSVSKYFTSNFNVINTCKEEYEIFKKVLGVKNTQAL
ncbi:glycosyltransferase family 4 protein [Candidatus Deianiraea vastatrix]|uniref:CapM-like glycosyltransferase n=1 Tax=Candidatus Deianiraea vastatrix TaxID=2163644 RepID=A0A5B8XDU4_9RICK|nr:glycosyltransferase family 4 protein [Candidatus Deianiraea vastatrix]QED23176.1 Putative CapM-like glycosyltransferase [Candidatus Deianiraea vastatrix]